MRAGRWPASLAWVIALGALLRIAAVLFHPPLNIDEARYLVTAQHLREGFGYTDWNGTEIDILPLHPLLTAALGQDPRTLEERGRMVSLLAGLLSLPVIALLATRLCHRTAALIAMLLVAFHPWLVRSASTVQPETLYVLFVAVALLLLRIERRPILGALAAGLSFAAAYLARPEGFLVAVLAAGFLMASGQPRRRALARAATVLAAFALASAPYLVWLRHQSGAWSLTGKASEVFFIGQAVHENGGEPPSADAVARLQREGRDGIAAYCLAHPGAVLLRFVHLLAILFLGMLPRALGPLGLIGLCALAILRPRGASDAAWAALPAVLLPLAAFAAPEGRVVAVTLPFLFVPAAAGLAAWRERFPRGRGRRAAWSAAGAALLLAGWAPGAARLVERGTEVFSDPQKWAARIAMEKEPEVRRIATNSPVVAFHLAAPELLGPPGGFRPLAYDLDCAGVMSELERRAASLAVLDRPAEFDVPPSGSCGLERLALRHDRRERRVITIDGLLRRAPS